MSPYIPIPVTRATSGVARTHFDVTYGFTKAGDLSIILSPDFLEAQAKLSVGGKVRIGFNPESLALLIAPPKEDESAGLRTIRPRSGFSGAGLIRISAHNIPEGLPVVAKRVPVAWAVEEDNSGGGVVLDLSPFRPGNDA